MYEYGSYLYSRTDLYTTKSALFVPEQGIYTHTLNYRRMAIVSVTLATYAVPDLGFRGPGAVAI